jgi:hypothetical protein
VISAGNPSIHEPVCITALEEEKITKLAPNMHSMNVGMFLEGSLAEYQLLLPTGNILSGKA